MQEKIPGKKEISEWGRVPKFAKGPAVVCGGHGEVHHWKPIVGRGLKKTGTYDRQLILFSFMLLVKKIPTARPCTSGKKLHATKWQ